MDGLSTRAVGIAGQASGGARWDLPVRRFLSVALTVFVTIALLGAKGQAEPPSDAHWAFRPIGDPQPPLAPLAAEHPIDQFIAARLAAEGVNPNPAADRRTLIRRLYFDLIGLPPASEEVTDFLSDNRPDAWERLVDRLLASPHYGERWGRHWLDVARYADTAGDNADYPIPEARLYRDYVIAAFNSDKPYDEFVREQLAGDLLGTTAPPGRLAERTVATGFLALSRRYATGPYELWHLTLEDSIDTFGRAFLGLTLKCARCHDHKFDPVTTEDYYALYGIFASTQYPWAGAEEFQSKQIGRMHFQPLVPAERVAASLAAREERLAALKARILWLDQEDKTAEAHAAADKLRVELRNLARTNLPPDLPGAYAVTDGALADARVQQQGDPDQLGEVVPRGVPRFLPGGGPLTITPGHSGRLELAQWLTGSDNPLVARVMANRVWQHHFGKGIVGTPSNFGRRGEEPTHPELLDWLARRLVDGGWSLKRLHRIILSSAAYQRTSADNVTALARDPDNRLYWRFNRRRLDAETLRDALLWTSGTLDLRRPGEHPFPPIAAWNWTQHTPFKEVYASQHRSVYLMTQRLQRHPYLALFDGPDTNTTTDQRGSSLVPLQALFFMNSPLVREETTAFARRLLAEASVNEERLRRAYQLTYARQPTPDELSRGVSYLSTYSQQLTAMGFSPAEAELESWQSLARVLVSANEFIFVE